VQLELQGDTVVMHLFCSQSFKAEEYQAEKHKKHVEKMLKRPIQLQFHLEG
jgi:exopolyphosphatase/guanosine-5'-triphosphate,3'-diphosphate pyrophosphatase